MLNKKAMRKYAADTPAPAIPSWHGLLHATQVDYIVRTAVRIIGHRRTLVLYVYDRKRAAGGDSRPVWTMFQAGEDYITLARREDGSTHWREAAFERLGEDYSFTRKCAFYSSQDEQRVCDFFRDHDHGGMAALTRAQQAILDKRAQERQRRRERRTIDRMRPLRALPRGLEGWVRRSIIPAYFRCGHTSARRPVTGICTSCGNKFTVPRAAHNSKIICPHCQRELTVKSIGKAGRTHDRDTVQVIEKVGDTEVVVRIVKVYYDYDRRRLLPKERVCENARIFIRRGPAGKVIAEPYYLSYSQGTLTHWFPGDRPVFSYYQYNFEADTCGHVYCRNLSDALAGTPWQYCPVTAFYEHFREPMQVCPFLAAYLEHPRFEHLIKTGFFSLAANLAYRDNKSHTLDESQDRTHRILRIAAEDVPFLRELGADTGMLEVFQGYAGLKDRQRLLRWQLDNSVKRDIGQALKYMTPHKFMRYMDAQYAALRVNSGRGCCLNMQSVVSEYRDYLGMIAQLGYDMGNSFVLYPRNLREAHDTAQKQYKAEEDVLIRRDFEAAMQAIGGRLDFEAAGMKIVLPTTPGDLIDESHELRHCVKSYAGRVANHECVIVFVRRCDNLKKPFYTVEVRNQRVVQVRGMGNCAPTPEVAAFMARWERQVLRAPAAA